ncbi:CRISPR-associated helicase Cas3' [Haloechinothrix sp. LS1_15]|uniref:type I-G CRISPR-associated helicase/endonuclease Cas3g n=1 Tax=Haloechinothrix sp. LS1_15 TaxID=2652248 RepID=UPI002948AB19|nr:CRISPR-associated helicase Cas3' [Haloechinothrix sp. LS1_15]MDV6011655.1 CRISPR-associated helicase Cas3' [Haloechinothrix sp. LS1_15]
MSFGEFVARAAGGATPYHYQQRLADNGLPDVLQVPTGAGKTLAAVLPWLYRRRAHPDEAVRADTPRWLVVVLPQRALVEQTAEVISGWLDSLGVSVPVHLLMGGEDSGQREWKASPQQERIFVGTQDMVLSRLLMRGFAESRSAWPASFGLLHNGVQFVFDEVQLMGPGLPTSLQLQGLREHYRTALPTRSMWMSATIDPGSWAFPDFPNRELTVETLDDADYTGALRQRLDATRTVQSVDLGDVDTKQYPRVLADRVLDEHRTGTRTLVVVNTVDRAMDVYGELTRAEPDVSLVLLHSRFRPAERQRNLVAARAAPADTGSIVVATQVLEAGIDLTSETLITELAPWTSLVQRAGRCNRDGRATGARLLWAAPPSGRDSHLPYEAEDLENAAEYLRRTEGRAVTATDLASAHVTEVPRIHPVLRRRDLLGLFDTAPDLSGNDVDVGPFIRDADQHTVSVAWREPVGGEGDETMPLPQRHELCPAPIQQVRKLVGGNTAQVYDQRDGRWRTAWPDDVRPTALLVLNAPDGGYRTDIGFDPRSKQPVPPAEEPSAGRDRQVPVAPEAMANDPGSAGDAWVPLAQHLDETEQAARELLRTLGVELTAEQREAVAVAARYHDLGKAHPTFVASLEKANPDHPPPDGDTVWAKSPSKAPLRHDPPYFRHELVSALLLLDEDTGLLEGLAEPDLATYLALAHHGKVRLSVRGRPEEAANTVLGVRDGSVTLATELPGGVRLGEHTLTLEPTTLGVGSLADRALRLRDRADLGPFRLAFCEALVRAADARASAAAVHGGDHA